MDGRFDWYIIEHADGTRELDGAHFTTPNGNFVFQLRPNDRPISADAAGKSMVKTKIKEMADLLLAEIDKL